MNYQVSDSNFFAFSEQLSNFVTQFYFYPIASTCYVT